MGKEFDIYVNGAYLGRAPAHVCQTIQYREAQRPHRVHGVVLEDTDPPRVVLNPTHDESPALVRRVVDAISAEKESVDTSTIEWNDKPRNLKEAAQAFQDAINAEPGIGVQVVPAGAHDIHAAITHTKWKVKVTRTKQEQVYP